MNNDRFLFRGKRVDNGEWVEGSLEWHRTDNHSPYTYTIKTETRDGWGCNYVSLETVTHKTCKCEEKDAEIKELEKECKRLWSLLDDISTYGDMLKPKNDIYFKKVNSKCEKRDGLFTSDGYNVIKAEEV